MTKASIISIGNELLTGQTISTNTAYLGEKLLSIGIPVVSSYTIGDDIDLIVRAFNLAASDADLILATGGLGPTDDDLTRQAFAKFLGTDLQLKNELLQKIQNFFTSREYQMPDKCKNQAYIPAGTKALSNNLGTAPGIMAKANGKPALHLAGKLLIALPGVPLEMKQMFEESVLPELKKLAADQTIVIRKLKCFGTGESNIAELLGTVMRRRRNPLVNCTAHCGVITLTIIATAEDKDQAQQMAEKDEKFLRDALGELIYGSGEQTMAEVVGEKLAQQKKTLAVAESCTGGTLAKLLTDIPGASRYFTYGWVTYSNTAKTTELGISADLIKKHGAVSEQVAKAMAQCARKKAATDFAVAITGIAGSTGSPAPIRPEPTLNWCGKQKPVGLVYISVDSDNGYDTQRYIFSGDRNSIRLQAAQTALNMLRLRLKI